VFEVQRLGNTERSIVVQTRKGNPVPNVIAAEPTSREIRIRDEIRQRHGTAWRLRKKACGVYNCAGLAWASRRTSIYDDESWNLILQEDGYRKLSPEQERLPGDLVIYRDASSGFIHVGIILEVPINQGVVAVPRVLSKWDDASGEYIHWVNDAHFFHWRGWEIDIQYWTDRPE
jgi:hypothetical protein